MKLSNDRLFSRIKILLIISICANIIFGYFYFNVKKEKDNIYGKLNSYRFSGIEAGGYISSIDSALNSVVFHPQIIAKSISGNMKAYIKIYDYEKSNDCFELIDSLLYENTDEIKLKVNVDSCIGVFGDVFIPIKDCEYECLSFFLPLDKEEEIDDELFKRFVLNH